MKPLYEISVLQALKGREDNLKRSGAPEPAFSWAAPHPAPASPSASQLLCIRSNQHSLQSIGDLTVGEQKKDVWSMTLNSKFPGREPPVSTMVQSREAERLTNIDNRG